VTVVTQKLIYVDYIHNIWSQLTLIELITKKGNFYINQVCVTEEIYKNHKSIEH